MLNCLRCLRPSSPAPTNGSNKRPLLAALAARPQSASFSLGQAWVFFLGSKCTVANSFRFWLVRRLGPLELGPNLPPGFRLSDLWGLAPNQAGASGEPL